MNSYLVYIGWRKGGEREGGREGGREERRGGRGGGKEGGRKEEERGMDSVKEVGARERCGTDILIHLFHLKFLQLFKLQHLHVCISGGCIYMLVVEVSGVWRELPRTGGLAVS